jgi:endonuclease/exonuclease/phosphatase family metal-dependent hydrolase
MPSRHSGAPRGRRLLRSLALIVATAGSSLAAAEELSVVSYNVRYGTADDGEDHWTKRRDALFELLRQLDADLLGLQEALDFQIAEILDALPRYGAIGVGRDDGRGAGEHAPILFDRARFRVAESGTFWFSDTPSVPASASWGNRIPRIATWARLVDRDGSALWLWNVHLDHQSQASRERSTVLLAERIAARSPADPVVVTGDFNAGEDAAAMSTLLSPPPGHGAAGGPRLVDTFRVLFPGASSAGTFGGFDPVPSTAPKIDYVLVLPEAAVLDAAIVRWHRNGRAPSDHFPVLARVRLDGRDRTVTPP